MTIEVTSFIVFSGICVAAVLLQLASRLRLYHVISRQSFDVELKHNVIGFCIRETFRIANRVCKMNGFPAANFHILMSISLELPKCWITFIYVWHCLSPILRRNTCIWWRVIPISAKRHVNYNHRLHVAVNTFEFRAHHIILVSTLHWMCHPLCGHCEQRVSSCAIRDGASSKFDNSIHQTLERYYFKHN